MATEDLTATRLRDLLHYDPETGVFFWRNPPRRGGTKAGAIAGTLCQGYVRICITGRYYAAHRLAWLYINGSLPIHDIDHKDGEPSHNWIANLRCVTKSENQHNRQKANRNGKSGILGVCWDTRRHKWLATLRFAGNKSVQSSHDTQEEAIAARLRAKAQFHPSSP